MSTTSDTSNAGTITVPTMTPPSAIPTSWSLADLQEHLGGISLNRILLYRPLGMATEEDALWLEDHEDRLCELVDGVLVEKAMSFYESILAMTLGHLLIAYLETNNCGVIAGADGQIRLLPTKMRIPDLAFIRWDRFPGGKLPQVRVCKVAPDLVVEILSEGNTRKEMEQKLDESFQARVRLVWYIDARTRTARLYTSREQMQSIDANGELEGRDVLPGFRLRLGELFERADRRQGE
jgi:Uma2 family endonuclease